MSVYRVVTARFCCAAEVDSAGRVRFGRGTMTAPLLRRFTGQPIANLRRWISSLGGTVEELIE